MDRPSPAHAMFLLYADRSKIIKGYSQNLQIFFLQIAYHGYNLF